MEPADNDEEHSRIKYSNIRLRRIPHSPIKLHDTRTQVLKRVRNLTHLYSKVFCIHYCILAEGNSLCLLTQMAFNIKVNDKEDSISKYWKDIQKNVAEIVAHQLPRVDYTIVPIVVKRRGKFILKATFTEILHKDFEQLEQKDEEGEKSIRQVSELMLDQQEFISHWEKIHSTFPSPSEIIKIENEFFQGAIDDLDMQAQLNRKPSVINNHSRVVISFSSPKSNLPANIYLALKQSVYNPLRLDILFNSKHNNFTLHNSKYKHHNYQHFRDNVLRINESSQEVVVNPNEVQNRVEVISLLYSIKRLFFMEVVEVPCRGRMCEHIEFYDLRVLYESRSTGEESCEVYLCPVCSKVIEESDVRVIQAVKPILQMVDYHYKLNSNSIHSSTLTVDHYNQTAEYTFASHSQNHYTVLIPDLYQMLIDPFHMYYDPSHVLYIKRMPGFSS